MVDKVNYQKFEQAMDLFISSNDLQKGDELKVKYNGTNYTILKNSEEGQRLPTKLLTYYESHNKCDNKEMIKRNIKVLKKDLGGWSWYKGVIANLFRKSGLSKIKIEESPKENEQIEGSQWKVVGGADYRIYTPDKNITMVGREEEDRFEFKADVKVEEGGLEENEANFIASTTIRGVREFLKNKPDNTSIDAMKNFRAVLREEESYTFGSEDYSALKVLIENLFDQGVDLGFSEEDHLEFVDKLETWSKSDNSEGCFEEAKNLPQMQDLMEILYLANSKLTY